MTAHRWDYHSGKARAVFKAAGGDPELAGELARWAATSRGHLAARVVVGEDGTILGEGKWVRGRVGAAYLVKVTNEERDRDLLKMELDMAAAAIGRRQGCKVIIVKYSELCVGRAATEEEAR